MIIEFKQNEIRSNYPSRKITRDIIRYFDEHNATYRLPFLDIEDPVHKIIDCVFYGIYNNIHFRHDVTANLNSVPIFRIIRDRLNEIFIRRLSAPFFRPFFRP